MISTAKPHRNCTPTGNKCSSNYGPVCTKDNPQAEYKHWPYYAELFGVDAKNIPVNVCMFTCLDCHDALWNPNALARRYPNLLSEVEEI